MKKNSKRFIPPHHHRRKDDTFGTLKDIGSDIGAVFLQGGRVRAPKKKIGKVGKVKKSRAHRYLDSLDPAHA
jgi:hypothetical protein